MVDAPFSVWKPGSRWLLAIWRKQFVILQSRLHGYFKFFTVFTLFSLEKLANLALFPLNLQVIEQ